MTAQQTSEAVVEEPTEAEAQAAMRYLLFEDAKSKVLSAHGAAQLDIVRRWMGLPESDGSDPAS